MASTFILVPIGGSSFLAAIFIPILVELSIQRSRTDVEDFSCLFPIVVGQLQSFQNGPFFNLSERLSNQIE